MKQCPYCGGTSGYNFKSIEEILYISDWLDFAEQVESKTIRQTLPVCLDCGKRVNIEKWQKKESEQK